MEKTTQIKIVASLGSRLRFVSDPQEVKPIKEFIGKDADGYDSFFVQIGAGWYQEVWGMCGIVPHMSKLVTKLKPSPACEDTEVHGGFDDVHNMNRKTTVHDRRQIFKPLRGWESINIPYAHNVTKVELVRCYDNGGKTADRYTIVYMETKHKCECSQSCKDIMYTGVCSSDLPSHPQGVFQHGDCKIGKHLGKRIPFAELPVTVQNAVIRDLKDGE